MSEGGMREWPAPFLLGGRTCLDFVNTVNSRSRPATRDYLPDWAALVGWCRQVALFDADLLARLERDGRCDPAQASGAHAAAIRLRETLYRILRAVIDRLPADAADLARLDAALRTARMRQTLVQDGRGFAWRWDGAQLDLQAPLHAVASCAGAMLSGDDLRRLKQCPAPEGCGWLFLDETRNRSRRWCSMNHCGGAAKARRYAARHNP